MTSGQGSSLELKTERAVLLKCFSTISCPANNAQKNKRRSQECTKYGNEDQSERATMFEWVLHLVAVG